MNSSDSEGDLTDEDSGAKVVKPGARQSLGMRSEEVLEVASAQPDWSGEKDETMTVETFQFKTASDERTVPSRPGKKYLDEKKWQPKELLFVMYWYLVEFFHSDSFQCQLNYCVDCCHFAH